MNSKTIPVQVSAYLLVATYEDTERRWDVTGRPLPSIRRGWAGFVQLQCEGVRGSISLAETRGHEDEESARSALMTRSNVLALLAETERQAEIDRLVDALGDSEGMTEEQLDESLRSRGIDPNAAVARTLAFLDKCEMELPE